MKNILRKNLRFIKSLRNTRFLTSPWRRLPDFLIIGTMKGGTTSLYNYLIQHPNILPARKKEIHFFSNKFCDNIYWYKSNFALLGNDQNITGEASPYYLYYQKSPQRVFNFLPKVKLIVLLRNPISRAYSHFHRNKIRGKENLSFEEAISAEKYRLDLNNKDYSERNYRSYSYLARGRYVEQLQFWFNYFPKEQFLILKSEDLFTSPDYIFKQVLDFLDLPDFALPQYKVYLPGEYSQSRKREEMKETTKAYLKEYFAPYNSSLYKLLDRDFQWD